MAGLDVAWANFQTLAWYAMLAGSVAFGWTTVRIGVSTFVSTINNILYARRLAAHIAEHGEPDECRAASDVEPTGSYM